MPCRVYLCLVAAVNAPRANRLAWAGAAKVIGYSHSSVVMLAGFSRQRVQLRQAHCTDVPLVLLKAQASEQSVCK